MKKILLLAVATTALSTASFAASFIAASCGIISYNASQQAITPTSVACPSFAVVAGNQAPGSTIGVLPGQLTFSQGSLLFLLDNTQIIGVAYNITDAFTSAVGSSSLTGGNAAYSYGNPGSGANNSSGPPFIFAQQNGFTVNGTTPILNTAPGTVGGTSYSFAVVYDYTVNPSGVPEPSTVALIGAGLVGLASIARRRRS